VLLDAAAQARAASTSALEKALARAERMPTEAEASAVLLALARLPATTPTAALERLGLGLDAAGVWSQAELVHLMPTLDSLQISTHVDDFTHGIIDTRQLIYYLSGSTLALIFSILGVEAKLLNS